MIHKAFVMQVYPDRHAEYERRHNPIWHDLEQVLKEHGVHNYNIFLHPQTSQLFAYVEIEDEARWEAIAGTDACRRWWAFMGDIMTTNEDSSPTSLELKPVFHLP
jgi:L-rhamnose mutarotase